MTRDQTPDQDIQVVHDSVSTPSCQSSSFMIRQSARKRNPLVNPGFVPTQADSRKALQANVRVTSLNGHTSSPEAAPNTSSTPTATTQEDPKSQEPATSSSFNSASLYDLEQNSDDENAQAAGRSKKSKEDRKLAPRKDGTQSVLLYFKQVEHSLNYACVWCSKIVKASSSSYYNLKVHRDGSNIKGTIRQACPNRLKAIASGSILPKTASAISQESLESKKPINNTLASYVIKGRFDNNTFNKLWYSGLSAIVSHGPDLKTEPYVLPWTMWTQQPNFTLERGLPKQHTNSTWLNSVLFWKISM
ncbi:hypothetical protein PGT21_033175 [Puccinia graminis f. sp. tritici]|uniref:Uncharacterized protein n=1 Tax=Puccinia graminis f. sp. tritici TaxID=56615 RepID=A0A5B0QYE9_PUCGR|nr:hypothetical protein PGT21_033175 [Puccinia graminis f. sp. tritici]